MVARPEIMVKLQVVNKYGFKEVSRKLLNLTR